MNYETTAEVEWAVAMFFDPYRNIVVPNVSYGLGLPYEADLLIMTKAGYIYEVEIKVSKADLRADAKKYHHHDGEKIRKLWFAFPEKLCKPDCFELVPDDAGILTVLPDGEVKILRKAKTRDHETIKEKDREKLLWLGYIRVWHYRRTIRELRRKIVEMKNGEMIGGRA